MANRSRTRRVALLLLVAGLGAAVPAQGASAAVSLTSTPTTSASFDGNVFAIVRSGSRIYVGGSFSSVRAAEGTTHPRSRLAALDATTGGRPTGTRTPTAKSAPWPPPRMASTFSPAETSALLATRAAAGWRRSPPAARSAPGTPRRPARSGRSLSWATGSTWAARSPSSPGCRWNASPRWTPPPAKCIPDSCPAPAPECALWSCLPIARCSTWPGPSIGGHFHKAKGRDRERLAAFNPATGALDPWNPGADSTSGVYALHAGSDHLFVVGAFSRIGGVTQPRFAQFSGTP